MARDSRAAASASRGASSSGVSSADPPSSRSSAGGGSSSLDGKYWSQKAVGEDGRRRSARRGGGLGEETKFGEGLSQHSQPSGEAAPSPAAPASACSGASVSEDSHHQADEDAAAAGAAAAASKLRFSASAGMARRRGEGSAENREAESSASEFLSFQQQSVAPAARPTRSLRLRSSMASSAAAGGAAGDKEKEASIFGGLKQTETTRGGGPSSREASPPRGAPPRTRAAAAALSASRRSLGEAVAANFAHQQPQPQPQRTSSSVASDSAGAGASEEESQRNAPIVDGEETLEEDEATLAPSEAEETAPAEEEEGALRYGLRRARGSAKRELAAADEGPLHQQQSQAGVASAGSGFAAKRRRNVSPSAAGELAQQSRFEDTAPQASGTGASATLPPGGVVSQRTEAFDSSEKTGPPVGGAASSSSSSALASASPGTGKTATGEIDAASFPVKRKGGPGRPRLHPLGPRSGSDGKPLTLSYSIPWSQALADLGRKLGRRDPGVVEVAVPFGHFYNPSLLLPDIEEARDAAHTREYLRQKSLFQQAMRQQQLEEEERALQTAASNNNPTNASGEEAAPQGSSESSEEDEAQQQQTEASSRPSSSSASASGAPAGQSLEPPSAASSAGVSQSSSAKPRPPGSSQPSSVWRRGGRRRCRRGPRQGPVLVSYGTQQFNSWAALPASAEGGLAAPLQRGRILCGFGADDRAESYWASVRKTAAQRREEAIPFPPNPLIDEGSLVEVLSAQEESSLSPDSRTTQALRVSAARILECGFALREATAVEGALAMTSPIASFGSSTDGEERRFEGSVHEGVVASALERLTPQSAERGLFVARSVEAFRRAFVSLLLSLPPKAIFEGLAQRRCRSQPPPQHQPSSQSLAPSGVSSSQTQTHARYLREWAAQTSLQTQREAAVELEALFPSLSGAIPAEEAGAASQSNAISNAVLPAATAASPLGGEAQQPPLVFESQAFGAWDEGVLAFSGTPFSWMKPSLEWTTLRRVAAGGPLNLPGSAEDGVGEASAEAEEGTAERASLVRLPRGPAWRELWGEVEDAEQNASADTEDGDKNKRAERDAKEDEKDAGQHNNPTPSGAAAAAALGAGGSRPSSLATERENALRLRLEEKKQLKPPSPPADAYSLSEDYAAVCEALWGGAGAYFVNSLEEHADAVAQWDDRRHGKDPPQSLFSLSSMHAKKKSPSGLLRNPPHPALSRPDPDSFVSLYIHPAGAGSRSQAKNRRPPFSAPGSSSAGPGKGLATAGTGPLSLKETTALGSAGGGGASFKEETPGGETRGGGSGAFGVGFKNSQLRPLNQNDAAGSDSLASGGGGGGRTSQPHALTSQLHSSQTATSSASPHPHSHQHQPQMHQQQGSAASQGASSLTPAQNFAGGPNAMGAATTTTSAGGSSGAAAGVGNTGRKSPLGQVDGLLDLVRSQRALLPGVAAAGGSQQSTAAGENAASPSWAGAANSNPANASALPAGSEAATGTAPAQTLAAAAAPSSSGALASPPAGAAAGCSLQQLQLELDVLRVLAWRLRQELAAAAQQPDVGPRKLASRVRQAQSELAASATAARAAAVAVAEAAGEDVRDWHPAPSLQSQTAAAAASRGAAAAAFDGTAAAGGTASAGSGVGRKKRGGRIASLRSAAETDAAEEEAGETASSQSSRMEALETSHATGDAALEGGRPRRSAAGSRMATFVTLLKRGNSSIEPLGVPGEEALLAAAALASSTPGGVGGALNAADVSTTLGAGGGQQSRASSAVETRGSLAAAGGAGPAAGGEPSLKHLWNSLASDLEQKVSADGRGGAAAALPVASLQRVLTSLSLSGAASRLGVHRSTISRWMKIWNLKRPSSAAQPPQPANDFQAKTPGSSGAGSLFGVSGAAGGDSAQKQNRESLAGSPLGVNGQSAVV